MTKRINVTLPEDTIALMDRVTAKGDRSRLINQAVKSYVGAAGRERLRQQLEEGAVARAERDLAIAEEWFSLEDERWPEK